MKSKIMDEVVIFLIKNGFTLKSLTRTCFDLLARRGSEILLIKLLEDANSITKEYVNEMNKICSYVKGNPLIVSEKAGSNLQDNVVYSRFGIFCLNFNTFKNCINNKLPFIVRDHAGLTAKIIGEKLRNFRERDGISLKSLSDKIGVSRKMIQKYETEDANITIRKALKMYELFGDAIFDKINIFSEGNEIFKDISTDLTKKYSSLGFDASGTKNAPFDIIAKKEKELILTEVGDKANPNLKPLSQLLDADNLVIFKKKKPKNIPSLTKKEFLEFEKANELIKFLKEF